MPVVAGQSLLSPHSGSKGPSSVSSALQGDVVGVWSQRTRGGGKGRCFLFTELTAVLLNDSGSVLTGRRCRQGSLGRRWKSPLPADTSAPVPVTVLKTRAARPPRSGRLGSRSLLTRRHLPLDEDTFVPGSALEDGARTFRGAGQWTGPESTR